MRCPKTSSSDHIGKWMSNEYKNILNIFCFKSADVGFAGFVKGPEGDADINNPHVNTDLQRMNARNLPEWMKTVSGGRQHLNPGSTQKRQNKRNKIYLNYYYQSQ